jgi:hypothetical protein
LTANSFNLPIIWREYNSFSASQFKEAAKEIKDWRYDACQSGISTGARDLIRSEKDTQGYDQEVYEYHSIICAGMVSYEDRYLSAGRRLSVEAGWRAGISWNSQADDGPPLETDPLSRRRRRWTQDFALPRGTLYIGNILEQI